MEQSAIYATAATVLGYAFQWLFGLKKANNYLVWVGLAVASALAFIWATPDFAIADWRITAFKLYAFILAAKGFGSTAKAARLAPATDSI